jgi:hypothetical protein
MFDRCTLMLLLPLLYSEGEERASAYTMRALKDVEGTSRMGWVYIVCVQNGENVNPGLR